MAVLTTTLAVSGIGATSSPIALAADPNPDAATKGSWSAPFEEGGAGTPRCELVPNDTPNDDRERLQCKPTAVTTAVLPNGKFLYGNALESEENAEEGAVLSLSPESRDSRFRVLDLTDGTPSWTTPDQENAGGTNDVIVSGRTSDDCATDPATLPGVLGVPGRPGDGFAGNLASQLGVPPQEPTCAPDDVAKNDSDVFCGDIAQMADGRLLLVGGTDWYNEPSLLEKAEGDPVNAGVIELEGVRQGRIFDWRADGGKGDWQDAGDMKYGRWYPANVTAADGKQYIYSGTTKLIKSTQLSQVTRVESYDPATGEYTEEYDPALGPPGANGVPGISNAGDKTLPQNPRMFVAPDGRHFYSGSGQMWGPFGQAIDQALFGVQGFFDPATDSWTTGPVVIPRSSPAVSILPMSAPYDEMRILSVGGTLGPPPGGYIAQSSTEIATIAEDGTVTNAPGPDAIRRRWFGNATPLPTGELLVTHGAGTDEVIVPGTETPPVPEPVLYDPELNTFTEMASAERVRTYHNSASLLPNGQVIVGGNSPISLGYGVQRDAGVPPFTANNDKDPSFELFDPPYLFNDGDRPEISYAPKAVRIGDKFKVSTDDADSIERITLMRMPSIQHVFDSDARTLILDFERFDEDSFHVQMPANPNVVIPGYYYVFVNSGEDTGDDDATDGLGDLTPSVARIIKVGDETNLDEADEPFPAELETNDATPTENNTLLNNPPNPLEEPTVPGQQDPLSPFPPNGGPGFVPVPDPFFMPPGGFPIKEPAPDAVTPSAPGTPQGRRGRRH